MYLRVCVVACVRKLRMCMHMWLYVLSVDSAAGAIYEISYLCDFSMNGTDGTLEASHLC